MHTCGAALLRPQLPAAAPRGCRATCWRCRRGTGRNLPYYPLARMRSLTLTDTSRHMLVNAADKFAELTQGQAAPLPVRFELADAQQLVERPGGSGSESSSESSSERSSSASSSTAGALGAPATPRQQGEAAPLRPALKQQQRFPPRSFDVVVDTFGLCSQQDPVTALKVGWGGAGKTCAVPAAAECAAALLPPSSPAPLAWPPAQEMARVCKPGGRILLLQHGRGTWGFINRILDNSAGCGPLRGGPHASPTLLLQPTGRALRCPASSSRRRPLEEVGLLLEQKHLSDCAPGGAARGEREPLALWHHIPHRGAPARRQQHMSVRGGACALGRLFGSTHVSWFVV